MGLIWVITAINGDNVVVNNFNINSMESNALQKIIDRKLSDLKEKNENIHRNYLSIGHVLFQSKQNQ